MSTENIKEIINQYFDNELTKSEEVILFTQLSQDENAREYFKEMNLLKTVVDESLEEYPQKLDDKIYAKLKTEPNITTQNKSYKIVYNFIGLALGLILLALTLFFYNESLQYKNKLELTYQQVYHQNQMIQVLFNTLPQAEVRGSLENTIIVTPQM
ncbi:MAG: hypothetical protein KDC52_05600 [Ignavibacteriae bacterium]|nr:hypothetical protein [Ignavibacteriota bacterium]